jgi:tetratricopeptide (TPR) repeat protein
MERTKSKIVLIILLLLNASDAWCSYRSEIYNCYITGNMTKWKSVIDRMAAEKSRDPLVITELLNYHYGYIGWAIGMKKTDEAKRYLEIAEENLELLDSYKPYASIVNAYRSAFYGFRIGLNKVLAPFLGGKSLDAARTAIEQDKRNYLGYVQLGNSEFYMPQAFGGSKAEALRYYTKAQEIMESDPSGLRENWNYLSLLTVIAQAYTYTREFDKSKQYLDKILSIEPNFTWVKNELYQQLNNKMKN